MRPYSSGWSLPPLTITMPAFQSLGGVSESRHGFDRIEHAAILIRRATEMLPPQLEAEFASVLAGAVAEACGIDR